MIPLTEAEEQSIISQSLSDCIPCYERVSTVVIKFIWSALIEEIGEYKEVTAYRKRWGKIWGTCTTYSLLAPDNKVSVHETCTYVDGKKHGLCLEYDWSGKLQCETPYCHGKKHGMERTFYPAGMPLSVISYDMGKRHGQCFSFHSNGRPQLEEMYVHGHPDGVHKSFAENGMLLYSGTFKNGSRQGTHKKYSEHTGKPMYEISFVNNKEHGLEKTWDPMTGKLVSQCQFNVGMKVDISKKDNVKIPDMFSDDDFPSLGKGSKQKKVVPSKLI